MRGMLIDVTKCVGCEQCVAACVAANGLDPQAADRDRATSLDGLSDNRLTTIQPIGWDRFAKKACMHCLEPSCVSACLVSGITRREDGAVVYDPDKCIGCRYCMLACPFHVPRYEWSRAVPFMKKCELCADRVDSGGLPACVDACPEHAIDFGERDDLLRRAHRRIEAHPEDYIDHVWGEDEFGGTAVLYLSDVDLAELGWPMTATESIPKLTSPALHATPFIGGSVLTGIAGLNWIVKRRMQRMQGGDDDREAVK